MTSKRKMNANQQNAAKSTGPRSLGGKARASQNALRHGLAAKVLPDAAAIRAIELLACAIQVDHGGTSTKIARSAAAAQFDLSHIRRASADSWSALDEDLAASLAEGCFPQRLARLASLERYERRATSRRKAIFRRLLALD